MDERKGKRRVKGGGEGEVENASMGKLKNYERERACGVPIVSGTSAYIGHGEC